MNNKSQFLKKIEIKTNKSTLNLQQLRRERKQKPTSKDKHIPIKKSDILQFRFIGLLDKKIIITFHNRLQIFGYFDIHAIHERIRYQYYCWKIQQIQRNLQEISHFDEQSIQKQSKNIKAVYQKQKRIMFRVSIEHLKLFKEGENRIKKWGIEIQKSSSNQIYVTSSKNILGKQFSQDQILQILEESIKGREDRIPKIIDRWIGQFSCKSAYKFGDILNIDYAKALIYNLSKCQFPWHCVHGRNTVHTKSMRELSF